MGLATLASKSYELLLELATLLLGNSSGITVSENKKSYHFRFFRLIYGFVVSAF